MTCAVATKVVAQLEAQRAGSRQGTGSIVGKKNYARSFPPHSILPDPIVFDCRVEGHRSQAIVRKRHGIFFNSGGKRSMRSGRLDGLLGGKATLEEKPHWASTGLRRPRGPIATPQLTGKPVSRQSGVLQLCATPLSSLPLWPHSQTV